MQTSHTPTNRFTPDPTRLSGQGFGLFSIPRVDNDLLKQTYLDAKKKLGKATVGEREGMSDLIMTGHKLALIDDTAINREFNRHRRNHITEQGMLNALCERVVDTLKRHAIPNDYEMEFSLIEGQCVLQGYDMHEVVIDTTDMSKEERWAIYSAFDIIALYQLPLLTAPRFIKNCFCMLAEVVDSGEFERLVTLSTEYADVESLIEAIEDDAEFEMLNNLYFQVDGNLCEAVHLILEYEKLAADCTEYSDYVSSNNLAIQNADDITQCIDLHIALLSQYESNTGDCLIKLLTELKSADCYITFEGIYGMDADHLDYSMIVVDKAYENVIYHFVGNKLDELNNVGEPLCEAIDFDARSVTRLKLLSNAFTELTNLNKTEQ